MNRVTKELENSTSAITYRGEVIVRAKRANKLIKTFKIHNNAKPQFFYNVLHLIARDDGYRSSMPQYIKAFSGDEAVSLVSILVEDVNVSWKDDTPRLTLKFTLPYNTLTNDKTVNTYRLYSVNAANDSDYLVDATVDLDEYKISTDGKTNIVVEWIMTLSNSSTTTNTEVTK